ncbi:MAG: PP2C family protein-serine/threonine phosphatase [Flavobacteriales bacterium]
MALTKLNDDLVIERQKLNALLEITNAVNKNYKVKDLLQQFESVMRDYIGISKLAFINDSKDWKCLLSYGSKGIDKKFNFVSLEKYETTTFVADTLLKEANEYELLLPVLHKKRPLSFLLIGGIGEENMINFIQNHVGFVQTIANVVSVAIETKKLAKELIEKKLEEKDMELAAEMQKLLLPDNLPNNHEIDIAATYIAKQMVSGDYYDFMRINKEEYVFCIADVSGKGMPAAMLMANFQATLRANVLYNHNNLTLKGLVAELNKRVMASAKGEKYITFFIGYYNEKTRMLKYINAGHNYPILLQNNEVRELKTGSTALGVFETLPKLETEEIELSSNTIIVCYTDGLTEAENDKKEQFQTERLSKVINSHSYLNMKELNKKIIESINDYKGVNEFPDDAAILSLRII